LAAALALGALLWGRGHFSSRDRPIRLMVYAFSTQEPVLTQSLLPAFREAWAAAGGRDIVIESVFGPSATLAGQINLGAPADVTLFSNAPHVTWLRTAKRVRADTEPVVVGCTPLVIVVRAALRERVRDFADLASPGVRLLHADPEKSGVGEWSILAVYGSALFATPGAAGPDAGAAQLEAVWRNVQLLAPSARALMTLYELGAGDALITYEQDALLARQRGVDAEIVVPPRTVAACHVASLVDSNVSRSERPAAEALLSFMTGEQGQAIFRSYFLRPPDLADREFAPLGELFTPDDLGGWAHAHRSLVEGHWRQHIRPRLQLDSGPVLLGPAER